MPYQQFYAARYDASLVEVARPIATKQQYGAGTTIKRADSLQYAFEDGLISVHIRAQATAFHIDIRNQTDRTIKLLWDEASFIDLDGTSSRVLHDGVKYEGQIESQPPTLIPAKERLADDIFPANRVWYRTPAPQLTAGYQNGPLLMPAYAATVVHPHEPVPAAPDSFTKTVRSSVGKRFAIAILFEADGTRNEYTFWFRVDDAMIEAVARPRRGDLQNPCKLFSSLNGVVRRAANCTP